MESDVYFLGGGTMKALPHLIVIFLSSLFFSGCELLCQAGTGTCGLSHEEMQKALHPKAYGEYFVKSGVSRDDWRRDWVACGGRPNGQFSGNAPPGSATHEILAAWRTESKRLAQCMESKGYYHLEGFEYGKTVS